MNYQTIPNYTENPRHVAPLVKRTPAAVKKVFLLLVLLAGVVIYFGFTAYREIQQNRQMHDEQGRQLAKLEEQALQNDQQFRGIAAADLDARNNLSAPTKLWSDFNGGVCLISGTYVFIDPETGRPLRLPRERKEGAGMDEPSNGGQSLPTPVDEGELAEVDYEGTGFHVGDGYLLTNHHIAVEPWKYDVISKLFSNIVNAKPQLTRLTVFFPGRQQSYLLKVERFSSLDDIAVCKLTGAGASEEIPVLPLSYDAKSTMVGQPVMMMGYPMGIDRLLSTLPMEEVERLQRRYQDSSLLLLRYLARRDRIKPLAMQGHVMDLYDDRIVYDATSGEGGSGAPVFGPSGRVIGVHFGYFQQSRASNYAAPIDRGITLLKRAGWTPRN